MKIQSLPAFSPTQGIRAAQTPQPPEENKPSDEVHLSPNQPEPPAPEKPGKTGVVLKGALMGAAALAAPTLAGAAFGPAAAVVIGVGGAAAGILGGKASSFITLDFRAPAALLLGGGGAALALAGHTWGGPAVGVAAAAGALAMGTLLARN